MSSALKHKRKLRDRTDLQSDVKIARTSLLQLIRESRAPGAEKALLDAIAQLALLERHASPDRKMVGQFQFLFKRAKELAMPDVAGHAVIAIAREHASAGALLTALKLCEAGIQFLEAWPASAVLLSLQAERVQLLMKLGRFEEAQSAVVAGKPPSKQQRSRLESRLIDLLCEGPRSKFDLIQALWGPDVPLETAENRLKNVLTRIRSKEPGLIILENGLYSVADTVFVQKKRKAG